MGEKLTPRQEADLMALRVLAAGPDTIGVIDNEGKMAAALVFLGLEQRWPAPIRWPGSNLMHGGLCGHV